MVKDKRIWIPIAAIAGVLLLLAAVIWLYFVSDPWGFARAVPSEEAALRMQVVQTAEKYLGYNEHNNSHQVIIDIYNSHEPRAMDYEMKYTDSWCSAFVSAIAIQCRLTDIIPTECGCERHIGLFQDMERWEEKDTYLPLPGDLIFYAWDEKFQFGDCYGWADHIGIVVGTAGPFIKVIEGNKNDAVEYRYIPMNHPDIRGYALPDYASKSE